MMNGGNGRVLETLLEEMMGIYGDEIWENGREFFQWNGLKECNESLHNVDGDLKELEKMSNDLLEHGF